MTTPAHSKQLARLTNQLNAYLLGNHLYQPLLHASKGATVSESDFVGALMRWLEPHGMGREGQEHDKCSFTAPSKTLRVA
jgi:hypothetical protein